MHIGDDRDAALAAPPAAVGTQLEDGLLEVVDAFLAGLRLPAVASPR